MQQHIKYLVVEDEKPWSQGISQIVSDYFRNERGFHGTRIRAFSAYDGDQANEQLCERCFDLVTLDMNLSKGASGSKISGRDLLGEIAAGNSAYFVIIITGAIHDPTLEEVYGREAAALMRYGALNEAVKQIPAERVRILHKPSTGNVADAMEELKPHLRSALEQYCQVSFERNIFRPLTASSGRKKRVWEFRFNGGPRRTIQETPGFELYRSALSRPNHEMKVIALMKAIARSSGATPVFPQSEGVREIDSEGGDQVERGETEQNSFLVGGTDPNAKDAVGLDYAELSGFSILPDTPVDERLGDLDVQVESIIGTLLDCLKTGRNFDEVIAFVIKGSGSVSAARGITHKIAYYLKPENHAKARNEFSGDRVIERLGLLLKAIAPIIQKAEQIHLAESQTKSAKKSPKDGKHFRLSTKTETKELVNARQHKQRVYSDLKRLGLPHLVAHLNDHMVKDKGRLTYRFKPEEGFPPFWLTD